MRWGRTLDEVAHRYGKWPHELLSLRVEDFIFTLAVYLWANGEKARDHWWDKANEGKGE